MAAYFIFSHKVTDTNKLNNQYLPQSIDTFKGFDIEILVVDQNIEIIEGDTKNDRTVVLKFKNREQALGWYNCDAYQKVVHLRHESTDGTAVLCDEFDMNSI
ncbi:MULTISPECIES: DUF1330 domain-containing protein [Pseudoalteromonas]|uniref:DUF1330 domain-containing protein n=1 Tax=Pseudoalteromonas arctica A 37-1-2 TaxID=1117313 RepID=A0A290S9A5_9GAMM|nr:MULTISPECIES: DUF1330 domain-containing protein [Pseudoalteromonas]ATC88469.1 hypothetical protein PARC_b0238 [Pseudoalteromonas arctica A 37-1-2]MBH0003411.1 DUF1330 domain-containing protein [Pseudoalteromonas sp. SWYJZ12]